jgi:hypothetical protein
MSSQVILLSPQSCKFQFLGGSSQMKTSRRSTVHPHPWTPGCVRVPQLKPNRKPQATPPHPLLQNPAAPGPWLPAQPVFRTASCLNASWHHVQSHDAMTQATKASAALLWPSRFRPEHQGKKVFLAKPHLPGVTAGLEVSEVVVPVHLRPGQVRYPCLNGPASPGQPMLTHRHTATVITNLCRDNGWQTAGDGRFSHQHKTTTCLFAAISKIGIDAHQAIA